MKNQKDGRTDQRSPTTERTMSRKTLLVVTACVFGAAVARGERPATQRTAPPAPRFFFKIDPTTPEKDLLPEAPALTPVTPSLLLVRLDQVPEIVYQKPFAATVQDKLEHTAHGIARINHLNLKHSDYFLDVLVEHRPDLRGLPYLKGEACRLTRSQRWGLNTGAEAVRLVFGSREAKPRIAKDDFWINYLGALQVHKKEAQVVAD